MVGRLRARSLRRAARSREMLGVVDRDGCTVSQREVTVDDHQLAQGHPLDDLDALRVAAPRSDRSFVDQRGAPRRLDDEERGAAAAAQQGRPRYDGPVRRRGAAQP
jgi:hypothetical protein